MTAPNILRAGPFKGVKDTRDPYDDKDASQYVYDATNIYIPDGSGEVGAYARPGFLRCPPSLSASCGPLGASINACEIYTHTAWDGTVYRFAATNGKLYRFTAAAGNPFTAATDVTPVGVTISNSTSPTKRFYFQSHADNLIFTDGVNRPWIGTNLSATPITGTYIDIDGAAGAWTAQGRPVVYKGSLVFIAASVPGGSSIKANIGIVWSEPNQSGVGYTQTGYADFWNLIQASSEAVYALAATQNMLYYFRETSIGALSGTPNVNFSTTGSHDLIGIGVGTRAPAAVTQFNDTVFFVDNIGRPWRFSEGATPEPLWQQLRGEIDVNPALVSYPTSTAYAAVGAIVPQLNICLLGGWSASPTNTPSFVDTLFAFDLISGQYYGRWKFAPGLDNMTVIACLALMKDSNGLPQLAGLTCNPASSTGYKPFSLWPLYGNGSANQWIDGEPGTQVVVPSITVKTNLLGFSANQLYNATGVGTMVTQSTAPVTVTVQTPYTAGTTIVTGDTPNSSNDTTYRVTFGMDVTAARSLQLTMSPTTATSQWVLQSVEFPVVMCNAQPDDQ